MKILVMGLPGSGKTTLAKQLYKALPNCSWHNADEVRKMYNDWDFSYEGRIQQAKRMWALANANIKTGVDNVICDFVAPIEEIRTIFNADFTIWMNTIKSSQYKDTNKIFENPLSADIVIDNFKYNIDRIVEQFNKFKDNN